MALRTLTMGTYDPVSPRPLSGVTTLSRLPTPHFISITEAPSGWEERFQRQRKTAPAEPSLGILLLFLGIPLCFFSLFGCWPPTEQEAASLAVTARAAREAVTHLLPLLATWIGSAFVPRLFMVLFLRCTLSIFSRGVKRIIKKNEREKKLKVKSLLRSTRNLEKGKGRTFYRYVLKFMRDRYGLKCSEKDKSSKESWEIQVQIIFCTGILETY